MAYYRLYFLDAAGRIRDMVDMECADDAMAVALSLPHQAKGQPMELWNQDRVVRSFERLNRAA